MSGVSYFFISTAFIFAVSAYVSWHCSAAFIAFYGASLQIIAVGVVVFGLVGTLRVFAPERLKADLSSLLARLRFWRTPPPIGGAMNATEDGQDGMQGFGTTRPLRTGRLEDQLADLQQRVDNLGKVVANTRAELAEQRRTTSRHIEQERLSRRDEISRVRDEIKQVTVANPWATIFGIVCLVLGLLINGGAPYLAGWFGGTNCLPRAEAKAM